MARQGIGLRPLACCRSVPISREGGSYAPQLSDVGLPEGRDVTRWGAGMGQRWKEGPVACRPARSTAGRARRSREVLLSTCGTGARQRARRAVCQPLPLGPIMRVVATLTALVGAASAACLQPCQFCPRSGDCVLFADDCGRCKPQQYLCPNRQGCAASVLDYINCPGLDGTHLDATLPTERRLDYLVAHTNLSTKIGQVRPAAAVRPAPMRRGGQYARA